jgi:alkylated DNA repair dioxygenase AlkB
MELHLPQAEFNLFEGFFPEDQADSFFQALKTELDWKQEYITIKGATYPMPRLTAWYGDSDKVYVYSGLKNTPLEWTPTLLLIKQMIEEKTGQKFNSMLANNYRAGKRDSIGMHSDSEPELGKDPVIASVSFGRTAKFVLAPKKWCSGTRTIVPLTHGSLFVMGKGSQRNWMHGIDKEPAPSQEERINLTFRTIL